jgi:phosphoglycerol transferase MdoB-like AlkP superfamily enzyme
VDGREPIAVHPYMTSMYKRDAVYPILGFDKFVSEDDLDNPVYLDDSDFVSDQTAFDEVRHQIDATDAPLLVNLVTMQNHYPMKDLYDDPLPVTGLSGDPRAEAEGYGRGLQYTDAALEEFLAGLEASDEPTAVVFYGDHQPGIWPQDVRDRNGDLAMRETPFFVWANFPTEKVETAPVTSPIYFLPLLYDAVGAPLPPWYALLHDLYASVPAMEQGVYVDAEGESHSRRELPPGAQRLLDDYRLLQYDLSVGKRYTEKVMFEQAPSDAPVGQAQSPTG